MIDIVQRDMAEEMEYIYLGDKNTDPSNRLKRCRAIRKNGKCIRGRNGSMLVIFDNEIRQIVVGRLLRRLDKNKPSGQI